MDERRDDGDEASNGEIGYLHIRAMDAPSLRQFQLDLAANRTKKALVIDQRFNGGGGIDQELLGILAGRQYQYTIGRDAGFQQPRPQNFYGPMVVMQNERSASDAEMFPAGFKALGLGKVVGVPTMGAVIGTGSYTLLDGSTIRTPGSGVWTVTGQNMENYGVPPDVLRGQHAGRFPQAARRADREGGRGAEERSRGEEDVTRISPALIERSLAFSATGTGIGDRRKCRRRKSHGNWRVKVFGQCVRPRPQPGGNVCAGLVRMRTHAHQDSGWDAGRGRPHFMRDMPLLDHHSRPVTRRGTCDLQRARLARGSDHLQSDLLLRLLGRPAAVLHGDDAGRLDSPARVAQASCRVRSSE